MRPFATAFSATPPARHRFVEPVSRCTSRTRWRYASSSTACSAAATFSWCFASSLPGSRAGPNDASNVVREVIEVELEQAVEPHELAHPVPVHRAVAVWREAHHLPLVAVLREAEPLREGGVVD